MYEYDWSCKCCNKDNHQDIKCDTKFVNHDICSGLLHNISHQRNKDTITKTSNQGKIISCNVSSCSTSKYSTGISTKLKFGRLQIIRKYTYLIDKFNANNPKNVFFNKTYIFHMDNDVGSSQKDNVKFNTLICSIEIKPFS